MTRLGVLLRCMRDGRMLERRLDGELDDAVAADRIARHLEECERCGLSARTLTAVKRSLRTGRADADRPALRRLDRFHRSLRDGPDDQPGR